MKIFSFEKDMTFQMAGMQYTIVRIVPDPACKSDTLRSQVCYESMSGLYEQKSFKEILDLYASGTLTLGDGNVYVEPTERNEPTRSHRYVTSVSEKAMASARRKQGYIQAIIDAGEWGTADDRLGIILRQHAQSIGDKNVPSRSSVVRWQDRLKANNFDWQCLIDRDDRKGNRNQRFTESELSTYMRVLRREYLTDQRRSIKKVFMALHHDINVHNKKNPDQPLRMISKSALYRLKESIPEYDRVRARQGRHAANIKFRKGAIAPKHSRILEVAEIDHTPIDIVVCCEETGLSLGTPYLTMIIDAFSRMPLGFHVSFDPPCLQSVLAALEHAILPKTYVRDEFPCVINDWPAYGRMQTLVCDNGPEFHADELENICLMLGTIVQYCPSRIPFYKGKIERFLQAFNFDLIHDLPGTRFNNYVEAGDYQSEKKAVLTFKTLIAIIHKWMIDSYMIDNHEGINTTPLEAWSQSASKYPPMLPTDCSTIRHNILRIQSRKLRIVGIELFKIIYNSDSLFELRKEIGNNIRVTVRYSHSDLSHIYVEHPRTKELIRVDSTVPDYTRSLGLPMHKAIQNVLRSKNTENISLPALVAARQEINEMVLTDVHSRSKARRKETLRRAEVNSVNINAREGLKKVPIALFQDPPQMATELAHDLPDFDVEFIGGSHDS
ncbi:MAG: Mu transposase C-terminal domain-containing protein [Moraxellaceae bacterium]